MRKREDTHIRTTGGMGPQPSPLMAEPVGADVVFLTAGHEFWIRDQRCVGVRDRRVGHWVAEHPALGQTLLGGGPDGSRVVVLWPAPRVGECLYLGDADNPVRTAAVVSIELPPEPVKAYGHSLT